jgi:hypothetical protein
VNQPACGGQVWGTLETAAKEKEFNDLDIELFVNNLNKLVDEKIN